ncbi:MAG: AMP-binding protein [Calditrichia bacterium]
MASSFPFGQQIVWRPTPEDITQSNMAHFYQKLGFKDYESFFQQSIRNPEWFWDQVIQDLDIQFFEPYSQVMNVSRGIEFPKWCLNGKMNITSTCLDKWVSIHPEKTALIYEDESGTGQKFSYKDIYEQTVVLTNALKKKGIKRGDRIALYMPMIPDLLIAFLASIRLGCIIVPLFSGYGSDAILTRLKDAGVRLIFAADGFYRRGKWVSMTEPLLKALKHYSGVDSVIIHTGTENKIPENWIPFRQLLINRETGSFTEQTDADEPMMIIYTSGTTGKPKGAVHTHCGFPVKAAQDMIHCMDLKQDDVMFWISDMGWMMGPWMVFGTMIAGATMVFYNGSPDYPGEGRLWELVEKHAITHLGVSPSLIRHLRQFGVELVKRHDLNSLRMLGSTGSPWDPDSWMWVFTHVLKGKKPIINYSGGTEISGGIVCGNFMTPLKPCAFSGPVPGMDADVVDADGSPVRGNVGELVIRKPWIGMTRGFRNDSERYINTYWKEFPGIWRHGDFAAIDEDGLWYILGRSDDTINVAGKRVGPAELESIANSMDGVIESAAIGVPDPIKGEKIILFVVPESAWDERYSEHLKKLIADKLGKPLTPSGIYSVKALPKTRNAKIMRRLIKNAFLNQPPGDTGSLANPDSLDYIKGLQKP